MRKYLALNLQTKAERHTHTHSHFSPANKEKRTGLFGRQLPFSGVKKRPPKNYLRRQKQLGLHNLSRRRRRRKKKRKKGCGSRGVRLGSQAMVDGLKLGTSKKGIIPG